MTRAFAELVRKWKAIRSARDTVEAAQLRRSTAQLFLIVDSALEAWRHRAARGALRRRGEQVLCRWVRTSRLRLWMRAWRTEARRSLRANAILKHHRAKKDLSLAILMCDAWQRIAGLSKLTRRRMEAKVRLRGALAWQAWQIHVDLARRGVRIANHCLTSRARGFVRRWQNLKRAIAARVSRVTSEAFCCWLHEHRTKSVGKEVRHRSLDFLMQRAFKCWCILQALACRSKSVHRHMQQARLHGAWRQWTHLRKAMHLARLRPPTRQSAGLALSLSKGDALVGFSRFSVTLPWLAERSRQRACFGEGMREPSSVS